MFKKRETIIFSILAVGIIILNLLELNQFDIISGIGRFFLYFLFLCTLVYAATRVIRDRQQKPFIQKVGPLILGLILVIFFYVVAYLIDTDGGKRRLITGGSNHDPHFIHIQLFNDNTFKFINSGPFGGKYTRGGYSLQNDTLRLDNKDLVYLYPTLTLVLRKTANNQQYFESVDNRKFQEKLFINTDNRR